MDRYSLGDCKTDNGLVALSMQRVLGISCHSDSGIVEVVSQHVTIHLYEQ
jgi:hypothetical protein